MRKIGLFEKFISGIAHGLTLLLAGSLALVLFSSPISPDKKVHFKSKSLTVSFDHFSPAFAAFEDDYLFEDNIETAPLVAGTTDEVFQSLLDQSPGKAPKKTNIVNATIKKDSSGFRYLDQFDGSISVSKIRSMADTFTKALKKQAPKKPSIKSEELRSGSLFAMVNSNSGRSSAPIPVTSGPSRPAVKPSPGPGKAGNVGEYGGDKPKPEPEPQDFYTIAGSILLRDGLAFIGSMEVSWVVGDHELQVGSINVPDATFEIEVSKLVGDIIVSLYDSNDELIGEGLFNLNQVQLETDTIATTIEVLPIDWDQAGKIVHSDSLGFETSGSGVQKVVDGAEVALYAFNDATLSKKDGSFSFYNWKKTNSRTLAIASKEGFKDSIFMLDSKKSMDVLLFTEKYMDAFFGFIETLGIDEVKDQGTIYGRVTGVTDRSGYEVKIEGLNPIYFMKAGFATLDQKQTTNNGLFAFVGLQDGDYKVLIEKDGEILEEKLVAVEQGKISPLQVNLTATLKHVEFYDPMDPERPIKKVEISFFDGQSNQLSLDRDNVSRLNLTSSSDPGLMEIKSSPESSRTLISHNKGLQKVPFIQNSSLLTLASSQRMKMEEGLIVGFVQSEIPYRVAMVESAAGKVVYFNKEGVIISPDQNVAHGFIMSGFPKGLSSLLVEAAGEGTILGSDLVYSNHESVSVLHLDLLTPH